MSNNQAQKLANQALQNNTADETEKSDQIADTLNALQSVIERNANRLNEIKNEVKLKKQSVKNIFENDVQYQEAEQEAKKYSQEAKSRKQKIINDPQVISLNTQIKELKQQQKEIEETLSNHLLNYYSITNSTSVDTSDGDQWDFKIKAKMKNKPSK